MRAHQVDLIIPEPDQFADLVADEQFNKEFDCLAVWYPGVPFYYIGWNEDTPFFSDARVRLAMTLSINREQIVSEAAERARPNHQRSLLYQGAHKMTRQLNRGHMTPNRRKNCSMRPAGLTMMATEYVIKMAFRSVSNFFSRWEATLYTRLALFLKDELAKVGVEVIPDPYEWSVLIPKISDRQFESMVMGWGGDIRRGLLPDFPFFSNRQRRL